MENVLVTTNGINLVSFLDSMMLFDVLKLSVLYREKKHNIMPKGNSKFRRTMLTNDNQHLQSSIDDTKSNTEDDTQIDTTPPKTELQTKNHPNKQQSVILLVFGYCKSQFIHYIPMEIIQLIHQFYEATFYWKVHGVDEMEKFLNAKNTDVFHHESSIMIQDIDFECTLCPNGWRPWNKGVVEFYCEMKHVPDDIEYFTAFIELVCETTGNVCKSLLTMDGKGQGVAVYSCRLDECEDMQQISFYCFVDLLHIKYKENVEKKDFMTEIKMKTQVEHEWIISDKDDMDKMNKMHEGMNMVYDGDIDGGNWLIRLQPKGSSSWAMEHPGSLVIIIAPLAVPYGIKAMLYGYDIQLRCQSKGVLVTKYQIKKRYFVKQNVGERYRSRMSLECPDVDIDELFNEEWIAIKMRVDVFNIYDDNDKCIDKQDWSKYGFFG